MGGRSEEQSNSQETNKNHDSDDEFRPVRGDSRRRRRGVTLVVPTIAGFGTLILSERQRGRVGARSASVRVHCAAARARCPRYHALFAEAMRREASRCLGEEVLRTISRRASSWYEQANLLPEAIDAALLAGDIEQVARLIDLLDEHGDFYEQQTMLRWLEQIPEAFLATYPIQ